VASIFVFFVAFCLGAQGLKALPIGFGIHQKDLVYHSLTTEDGVIYFDRDTLSEASYLADRLHEAKPILRNWLGLMGQGDSPYAVITSSTTDEASFANFITKTMEIQTMGRGPKALAWHEYTHYLMYEHLENFLGPAGSVIHLPWMPAWFIEGLAEAITMSSGSDWQLGVERYQALAWDWPTYDRLHQLYGGGVFSSRGYATAGGFVAWLLRSKKDFLPQLLKSFYRFTWPDYYLLSYKLPMDRALEEIFQRDGKTLYEEYKAASRSYWMRMTPGPLLTQTPEPPGRTSPPKLTLARLETKKSQTQFCSQTACPLNAQWPQSLTLLGQNPSQAWLSQDGDQRAYSKLVLYDLARDSSQAFDVQGKLLEGYGSQTGDRHWFLVGVHGLRKLQRWDSQGTCTGEVTLADTPVDLKSGAKDHLILTIFRGSSYPDITLSPDWLAIHTVPCQVGAPMGSPLEEGIKDPSLSIYEASLMTMGMVSPGVAPPLPPGFVLLKKEEPYHWKARHILTVPWLGSDDPLGPQIGVMSVPLMDALQNETVRATVLYGIESRFPNTEISLQSTRFTPTLTLTGYYKQVYNGIGLADSLPRRLQTSYLRAKGASLGAQWGFSLQNHSYSLGLEWDSSYREPYLGPKKILWGSLHQISLTQNLSGPVFSSALSYSMALVLTLVPKPMNPVFSYHKLATNMILSYPLPFLGSRLTTSLDASATQGSSPPLLKELYMAQKTFIAGTGGGGFQQMSWPIAGDGALFKAGYGDRQLKKEIKWAFPLLSRIEKQAWLFYFDKLTMTTYLNHGSAFWHNSPRKDRLAYGTSWDLFFENKGIRFNAGLGYGRLHPKKPDFFGTAGFDALF
jgi:hypothetical protein